MFQHVEPYPGDPILSLNEAFQRDPRPGKINLSIGIYFDEAGRIPVLESVRRAEAKLAAAVGPKPYLPIEGAENVRAAVQALLFGAGHEAVASGRVATIQSIGSSGGLKVGADFIARWLPGSEVWVSDPTWDNHRAMFEGAGLKVHAYPYYDPATGGLEHRAVVVPGRVADPDLAAGQPARDEVGADLQATARADRLDRGHAPPRDGLVPGAEQQRLDRGAHVLGALDRQVGLGPDRCGQLRFGPAHRLQHRNAAGLVEVDADAEVDLARPRVALEGFVEAEDRVARIGLDVLEHAALLIRGRLSRA